MRYFYSFHTLFVLHEVEVDKINYVIVLRDTVVCVCAKGKVFVILVLAHNA